MTADRRIILVLGGARSGKSWNAEALAEAADAPVYIATAEALDGEMADRIAKHRARRDRRWKTVEAPHALAAAIRDQAAPGATLLVDCITLWLSNVLLAGDDVDGEIAQLLDTLDVAAGTIILVSNEVGLGIVPEYALARRFRDAAGMANQRLAKIADEVVFMTAGLPLILKTDH